LDYGRASLETFFLAKHDKISICPAFIPPTPRLSLSLYRKLYGWHNFGPINISQTVSQIIAPQQKYIFVAT
jgi:hypothetical protein